jgi:hypothetical protein
MSWLEPACTALEAKYLEGSAHQKLLLQFLNGMELEMALVCSLAQDEL